MLKLAGVGKCLRKFQLLRHTPMAGLPEFAAHPAVDPIHHHLQDWLNYPHVSSITQKKKHVEKFETQNRIEFPGNKNIYRDTLPKHSSQKRRVFGGCFWWTPKTTLRKELFVAPRHGVAIKGGADLTLTGSGFVYPAVRAPLDGTGIRWLGWWPCGVIGRWESYHPWNL